MNGPLQERGGSACTRCVSLWLILCQISLLGLMFKPSLGCWLAWVRAKLFSKIFTCDNKVTIILLFVTTHT